MRLAPLLLLVFLLACLSMVMTIGCDDLTTEVNNNTYYDSTLGEDCLRCHSDDDNAIKQPKGQWATSRHASPDLIEATVELNTVERKTNVCGPQCHTSEGFIKFAANGTTSTVQAPSVIDCFTCHMPHSGEYGSWQLDTLRGFEKPVILNGDFDYDMGNSNMCVACHQAAKIPTIATNAVTFDLDSLGTDGPHYSSQAHVLIGKGGFRFSNTTIINSHPTVASSGGCLSCHFGTGVGYQFGEHTFRLEDDQTNEQYVAACNNTGCHSSQPVTDFDGFAIQDSITSLSDSLAGLLMAAHILTGEDQDTTAYFLDSTIGADEARILFNYLLVKKDGSRGIHNAKYATALLTESVRQWDSIPRASFNASSLSGCAPLAVTFTNTSTGAITSYHWDFDTDNLDSAITRDAALTFNNPGSYNVKLIIRNAGGLDSLVRTILVDSLPSVAIAASDSSIVVGDSVTLTQTVERSVSFLWDFGDSRTESTIQNPKIAYSTAGTFVVTLTVTNPCGPVTDSLTIVVSNPVPGRKQ